MAFIRRLKELFRKERKERPNLDEAVQIFVKARGNHIEELCDVMCISPVELYESVSEGQKTNVRVRMNDFNKLLLRQHIHRKIFGY